MGGRHYVRADFGRVSVSGRRAGCLEPQNRRLVDGQPSARRAGLDALEMALGQRRPAAMSSITAIRGPIHSLAFGKRCKEAGVRPSMGSVGDAYDNAMCESFFATLECELLDRRRFASQAEARMACFSFIEGWYNPVRLHSALNYRPPIRYEKDMQTELLPTKS